MAWKDNDFDTGDSPVTLKAVVDGPRAPGGRRNELV